MDQTVEPKEPASDAAARWRFGEVVLDEATLELTVAGAKVELRRKPLALLMFLLRNPGEVITKDELFEAVWPGRIVSETSLTNAIGLLRVAIGDHDQQVIKVVYGYGYRFNAEVRREDAPRQIAPPPAFDFKPGMAVPHRGEWSLEAALGGGGFGEVWLAQHRATREKRVFKFARDVSSLGSLKREITLFRLMRDDLGERDDRVELLDWNLEQPPYFIGQEWCAGGSLPQWADRQGGIDRVALPLRLELVAQAAEALAAAHSVGVLHKDLKPSNLLVVLGAGGVPRIKLADFGSAHLLSRDRLTPLNITQMGFTQTMVGTTGGTPLYSAPEVIAGQPSTIQSDLYALGVILYQVAVGDLRKSLAPGWERGIDDELLREDIAAAAAGDPQQRLIDAAQLAHRLRSLDERRAQRAQERSAEARAAAALRQLERQQARRGLRLALASTLAVGLAATSYLLWQSTRAQKQALSEAARANAVTTFLTDDLLSAANPIVAGRRDVGMREVLDNARQQLDRRFGDQPRARATLERVIGSAYAAMGEREPAEQLLTAAEAHLSEQIGPAAAETQAARVAARNLYVNTLGYADALRWSKRIVEVEQAAGWPNLEVGKDAEVGIRVVECLTQYVNDAVSRCAESTQASYREMRDRFGPDSAATVHAQLYYGIALMRNDRFADAAPVLDEVYQTARRSFNTDTLWLIQAAGLRHSALAYSGRAGDIADSLEEMLATETRVLGAEHRLTLISRRTRAHLKLERGDGNGAVAELQDIWDIMQRSPTFKAFDRMPIVNARAKTFTQLRRYPEAKVVLQEGLEHLAAVEKPSGYWTLRFREQLAGLALQAGDKAEAERLLRQNLADATTLFVKGEWLLGWDQYLLGDFLLKQGRRDEARPLLAAAHPVLRDALSANDQRTQLAAAALAQAGI